MIIVKMASSLQKGLEYREFQEVMVSRYCKILNKSPGLIGKHNHILGGLVFGTSIRRAF